MVRKVEKWIVFFTTMFLCVGCTDLFEESLREKEVILLSPGKRAKLNFNSIEFRWNKVDFAINYQVQIATPSFDSAFYFFVDTIVGNNQFATILSSGEFEWRVKARNGSSETKFTTGEFGVLETKKK